jgi:hypothetical protein
MVTVHWGYSPNLPVLRGSTVTLSGRKPLGSVGVAFYYRILPKGNWVYAGSTKTVNSFGTFSWREPMSAIGDLASCSFTPDP